MAFMGYLFVVSAYEAVALQSSFEHQSWYVISSWFLLISSPLIVFIFYLLITDYPKVVIKTAKKLKLGYWKRKS
jgi:hypothetical protein